MDTNTMHPAGRPVRSLLRLEGLAVALAGLTVWAAMDGGWVRFGVLLLLPDIVMAGYLWGPRAGAALYNAGHSYALPLLICLAGGILDHRSALLTGTLWLTHIGVDRALGYGLKYSTGFRDTHLGRLGREPLPHALRRTGEHLAQLAGSAEGDRSTSVGRAPFHANR